MTKVQLRFALTKPLEDALLPRIAAMHGQFGFCRVQLTPAMDQLLVEYDASRLTIEKVENALGRAGLPVQRIY